jgi:hypothetical protein
MNQQTVQIKEDEFTAEIEVREADSSISWSRSKTGVQRVRALTHKSGEWVSLTVSETPEGGRTTQTMATLKRDAARALYQQLHAVYG